MEKAVRSFGVRQLAAAFLSASLLAPISSACTNPSQPAGWWKSGSKLPHSKAPHRMPTRKRYSAARPDLSGQPLPNPR